jgi:integrase
MPTITRGLAAHPPPVPDGVGKLRLFDDKLPGLIMEVRPSGLVSFYIRYRDQRSRQREIRLGRYPEVTIDQVRKRAGEIKAAASLGGDPAAERDKLRAVPTFASFVEDRYLPFAKERLRSYRDHESFYRLRLKRVWGASRIDEITPHDVVELQDKLRAEGLSNATTNRYTAFVRRVFNLAIRWQILNGRNPAQHAEMRREQHRDTFLSQDQLKVLFRALDEEPNQVAAGLIAFLAATGARRGEAMTARWEHIDLDRRLWTVPMSKSGRRRHIPLSDGALLVLQRLPGEPGSPWVFPGAKGKPIGCVRKAWTRIKARAGIPADMRIHDLRHTFASMIVGRGRSLQEVGALLGHSTLSMTQRYAHLAPAQLIAAANEALPDFS